MGKILKFWRVSFYSMALFLFLTGVAEAGGARTTYTGALQGAMIPNGQQNLGVPNPKARYGSENSGPIISPTQQRPVLPTQPKIFSPTPIIVPAPAASLTERVLGNPLDPVFAPEDVAEQESTFSPDSSLEGC